MWTPKNLSRERDSYQYYYSRDRQPCSAPNTSKYFFIFFNILLSQIVSQTSFVDQEKLNQSTRDQSAEYLHVSMCAYSRIFLKEKVCEN